VRNVSKDEFYAALYADKRDIMPSIVGAWSEVTGYTQEWRTNDSRRELFGVTKGRAQSTYELAALVTTTPAEDRS
jgi:hypothetical protein